ncbi:hypothetical protein F5Y14DRAFT_398198 [Nemania sp. NC0429]|nr:hypothetical protein F5Y14DRAFT_398198 [Nemania sp. NC0429]
MAITKTAILALAGLAFAHMDGNHEDVHSSNMLYSSIHAADNCDAAPPSTSTSVTGPLTMVMNNTYHAPTRANVPGTVTSVVGLSMVANSLAVTSMADTSSTATTNPMTITSIRSVATGGISRPNISAIASQPVLGGGFVNGVSISLFIVSVGLTALLQM